MAVDRDGKILAAGQLATLLRAPPELLSDLPAEDQDAILDMVGQLGLVVAILPDGSAEFEFDGGMRAIWIDCRELRG